MLVAAIIFAGYSILVRFKPGNMKPIVFASATFTLGFLMLCPWCAYELTRNESIQFSVPIVMSVIYLGIGPSLIAFLCWNRSIMVIGPVRAAFIYYSLPLFSGIEALYLLNESIQLVHIFSGFLIIIGLISATRS